MYRETEYTINMSQESNDVDGKPWRFMTNHTQVLLCIARDEDVRTRDIAQMVGITERATQRIVADLVEAGFVTVERIGRRNRYAINREAAMRHDAQAGHPIGELLDLLELELDDGLGAARRPGQTPHEA
jgi:predicted ArsR family transcriptional regulator